MTAMQKVLNGYQHIESALKEVESKHYMLVCDSSFPFLPIKDVFDTDILFDQFTPNPLYEQVCKGVELFNTNQCDAIVAIGGGSTIDVAKCIKLFCKMDSSLNYLQQGTKDSGVPLIAIPTTAGTGSESTQYAVIYFEGKKQSITHESIIPEYAILEPALLKTLPLYQKKCTMMDALCQGIESWWSVNSTNESKTYSKTAVELIITHWKRYILENDKEAAEQIMLAANYSGKAINIAQTTAAHAMSYKITSLYGLPHGHAVAVCLPEIWLFMMKNINLCIDTRGEEYLTGIFQQIAEALGFSSIIQACDFLHSLLAALDLHYPISRNRDEDLEILTHSINPVRLKNNPVSISEDIAYRLYNKILK